MDILLDDSFPFFDLNEREKALLGNLEVKITLNKGVQKDFVWIRTKEKIHILKYEYVNP